MAVAFVFPGQGSQAVGMGKSLAANFAAARLVFDEVDAALASKLSTIIFRDHPRRSRSPKMHSLH